MSEQQEYKLPETKERLGFFGYVIGLFIFFPLMLALNLIPGISDIFHLFFYVEPGYTLAYFLSQTFPFFLAIPFFFIRRKKTKI